VSLFTTSLDLNGRAVVCAAGGVEAMATITALLEAGARVFVITPAVAPAVRDLGDRGLVTWLARPFEPEDLRGAALVLDDEADDTVREAARQHGVAWAPLRAAGRTEAAGPARRSSGRVILVGGGPGDPGLLTVAGLAAIKTADVVISDRLAPLAALQHVRASAELIDVGKIPRGEFTPQEQINKLLVQHAQAGRAVVRLKGGDSFVFGRGGEEWQACAEAGIPVTIIPGVSSATAGPALAGIPLTHRTLTQGFTVVSGHLPPGDPDSTLDWSALARSNTTLVIMMGVASLPAITAELAKDGLPSSTPAATVADAGLPSQRTVRGTLADIAARTSAAGIRPPAITVIGAVAGFVPQL
jgi:uroporphyrin-III C-methyltransferase